MAWRGRGMMVLLVSSALGAVLLGGALLWWEQPTMVTIEAGRPNGLHRRFAERLAAMVEHAHAGMRVALVEGGPADLAILRTDGKLPAQARAVAVLEHDMLLIIGRRDESLAQISGLRGHHLAVLGEDGRNEALLRQIFDFYQVDAASTPLEQVAADTPIDGLLNSGQADFVIAFAPLSKIATTRAFEDLAQRMDGFAVFGAGDAKALERKIPGLFAEVIDAGLLSGAPRIPESETDTVALREVLVAGDQLPDQTVADLMRLIFDNKAELAVDHQFATRIEPPDLDKDALIAAHEGAIQYVESEVKGFFDRYSDLIYLLMSVGSVAGSVALALFTAATRRGKPVHAGARAHDLLEVGQAIRAATAMAELDEAEAELDRLLAEVLAGLKDGSVSSDGLDAFRLGYEHSREALATRRRQLSSGVAAARYTRPG